MDNEQRFTAAIAEFARSISDDLGVTYRDVAVGMLWFSIGMCAANGYDEEGLRGLLESGLQCLREEQN